jgi:uncharacterized protein (DUF1697 family)
MLAAGEMPPAPTHVALLRAVNLGPHNKVGMADLRGLLVDLGFADARTLLQSGNVVFTGGARAPAKLESLLQDGARRQLGLDTAFFVRTAEQWRAVIDGNPFVSEARKDPGHLVVLFLKEAPGRQALAALRAAITGREVVEVDGRQAYAVYPDGIGRSKLTAALLERKLGTPGTGRNWNTVLKLAALLAPPA